MKNTRPKHLFGSLIVFLLLVSFTSIKIRRVFTNEITSAVNKNPILPNFASIAPNPVGATSIISSTDPVAEGTFAQPSGGDSTTNYLSADENLTEKKIDSIGTYARNPILAPGIENTQLTETSFSDYEKSEEKEFYKYDSVAHTFKKTEIVKIESGFDPVRFRLTSSKDSISIGEEFEIKIIAEFIDVSPRAIFQFEGSNEFTLKMLLPAGFIQTGGTYYDFVQGKVDKTNPKQEFTIKGFMEAQSPDLCFSLLRSAGGASINDVWAKKTSLCLLSKRMNWHLRDNNNIRTIATSVPVNPYNNLSSMVDLCTSCTHKSSPTASSNVSITDIMTDQPLVVGALWGCILRVGDTKWFYFQAKKSGNIKIQISIDSLYLDYITFGPFNNLNEAKNKSSYNSAKNPCVNQGECGGNNLCNYQERKENTSKIVTFENVQIGKIYTICVSHFYRNTTFTIEALDKSQICEIPEISINPENPFEGSTLLLNGCENGTVTWQRNGIDINNALNVLPGTYTAKCAKSECNFTTKTVEVKPCSLPNPIITPSDTIVVSGSSVTLRASGCTGIITWGDNGQPSNMITVYPKETTTYTAKCTAMNGCVSWGKAKVQVPNCGDFNIYAYSNATNTNCGVSVGDSLVLYGGLENEVPYDAIEWLFNGIVIPNSNFGVLVVKQHATLNDSGIYSVRIFKNGIWCAKDIDVTVCPCSFSAKARYSYTGNATAGKTTLYSSYDCPKCAHTWTLPNLVVLNVRGFDLIDNERMNGFYKLVVSKNGCTSTDSVYVKAPIPPQFNSIVSNAFCDNVSGDIRDLNNPGLGISPVTLEYKNITTNSGIVSISVPVDESGNFKFPWTLPANNTYEVRVKEPNGQYIGPYVTNPAVILCCSLALNPNLQPQTSCNATTNKGRHVVYLTGHTTANVLQYRLYKKSYGTSNFGTYEPVSSNWTVIPVGTEVSFIQLTDLERGFYKIEIVEGNSLTSPGCKILNEFTIDCEPELSTDCGKAPLISVLPNETFSAGTGISPTLYAEPLFVNSNTPTGLGYIARLNGNNSIQLGSQYGTQHNAFEAWIKVENNTNITNGYIGVGEKHRKFLQYYSFETRTANGNTYQVSFKGVLSVGSNGVTLIEEIPHIQYSRRVALSIIKTMTGWNHIALVYRDHKPELYLNGILVGQSSQSIFTIYNVQSPDIYNTQVGYNQNQGYKGLVDEIRMWFSTLGATTALTSQTLTQYAKSRNNVPAIPYDGRYWTFENSDKAKSVANDSFFNLIFEDNVQVFPIPLNDDKAPQQQDYKWYLNGLQVGTGNYYTLPANLAKANNHNFVLKYTGSDGAACETSKLISIQRCLTISPATTQNVCEGTAVTLTASGNAYWFKEGVTAALNQAPAATFTVGKSIDADGVYYAKGVGCSAGMDESERVTVKHAPVSKISAVIEPNTVQTGSNVVLNGKVIGDNPNEITYNWTGPNGFTSNLQRPFLTNVTKSTQEGTYTFSVTEITQNLSCTSTATVKLIVNNCSELSAEAVSGCSGNLGTITVNVIGNTAGRTIEYSLNNTTWQTSNVFSSLLSGNYKVYARTRVTGVAADQPTANLCNLPVQEVTVSCGTSCTVSKKLNYDRWDNIPGSEIKDFSSTYLSANVFNKTKSFSAFAPDMASAEKTFEVKDVTNHGFIARITGFICPPATGKYKFYISTDNSARLYLKTGSSLQEIIIAPNQLNGQINEFASDSISLTAGTKYQIELHHKQGESGNLISLKWQLGSGVKQLVSAQYLDAAMLTLPSECPKFELASTPLINSAFGPTDAPYKIAEGTPVKFIATAVNGYTSNFKWKDMQTGAALFDDPKATSGLSEKNTNSGVALYIRPGKTSPTTAYEDKVYRVSYSDSLSCYKEVKLRVVTVTCDCEGGNCDNISIQNPGIVDKFPSEKNYVVETVYLDENATTGTQTVTYMDGLGRPIQKINIQAGPDKQDLVQAIEYDAFGRSPKGYLPYPKAGNAGGFVSNATTNTTSWYAANKGTDKSYTLSDFETSPLNRVLNQKGPGYDNSELNGNTQMTYGTNGNDILMFTVIGSVVTKGTYPPNSLFKTSSIETAEGAEALTTHEYKDREGKVVCKDVGGLKTYYVYNDFGQLVCVIPPEATLRVESSFSLFGSTAFHELIFQYEFNERGLMIKKKVPGAVAVTMTYDSRDRLIATTDYRNDNLLVTAFNYDEINRLVEVKERTGANGAEKVVKQTYYDHHDNIPTSYRLTQDNKRIPEGMNWNMNTGNLKGLMVGFWEAIYKPDGSIDNSPGSILPTTIYYDNKLRAIQTVKKNHKGFIDYSTSSLDFAGRTLATYQSIENAGSLVTKTKTGYDYGGRPTALCQKIDKGDTYSEAWQPVASYTYNDIGEMTQKILGCRTQVVDYNYNIRGWLKTINNPASLKVTATKEYDFYGMSLAYTADGNIREQRYRTAITKAQFTPTGLYTDTYDIEPSQEFVYDYKYDNLKRLQRAELKRAGSSVFVLGGSGATDPGVTYDANGNILTMKRITAGVTVDNLTYGYNAASPNQLTSISDGGTTTYAKSSSYAYYTDGSVKKDAGRGINDGGITYNNQKLVSKMVANGVNYEYIYSNSGQKLQMNDGAKRYDYIGNAVYLNDKLEFVGNAEGRWIPAEQLQAYNPDKTVVPLPTVAKYGRYEYQLKDHLGNLRTSCRCVEKPNATAMNQAYPTLVTQENHYDPWGVGIEREVVADTSKLPKFELKDRFTYNGKELQGNLNYLDYGARMYDPSIGRWGVVDPVALLSCNNSPYSFVKNDPINYIDVGGLFRFPKEIRKEFPYSVSLLRRILKDLNHAPALKESIKDYFLEGVSSKQLNEDFADNKGPEIEFTAQDISFGNYTGGNSFEIDGAQSRDPYNNRTYDKAKFLQDHLLNRLEYTIKKYKKTHNENDRQEMREHLLLTTITILHEYIHVLDNRNLTPGFTSSYPGDDKATPWERRLAGDRKFQFREGNKNITPKQAYREKKGSALIEIMFYVNRNTNSGSSEESTDQKEVKRYTRTPGDDE